MKKTLYSLSLLLMASFAFNLSFAQNAVTDPSMEGGTPSASWTESSTNFTTPLCDGACGTCGGPCGPLTGVWYAWFGGTASAEVGTLAQSVTIPTSTDTTWLEFGFSIATAGSDGFFAVMMDTDTIWTATQADSTMLGSIGGAVTYYTLQADISSYATGAAHLLTFYSSSTTDVTNFLLDDVFIGAATVDLTNTVMEHISVFPTPASEDLTIDIALANSQDVKVEMTTLAGQVVYSNELNNIQNGKLSVDVRNFASGTYFVTVYKAGSPMTTKVTVQ